MVAGELAHGRRLPAGIGLGVFDQFSKLLNELFSLTIRISGSCEATKRIKLFRFVARLALGGWHEPEYGYAADHAADIVPVAFAPIGRSSRFPRPRRPCKVTTMGW